jgi:hypothetical protein
MGLGIPLGLLHTSEIKDPAVRSEFVQLVSALQGLFNQNPAALGGSSSSSGFMPITPGDATKYLNGDTIPTFAAVKDSDLSLSDITTNNVSTTKHGFVPKAPADATKFLDGTGAFSTPSGGGTATAFPIRLTTNTTLAADTGWVLPEALEIAAGIILTIDGGARLEITGPVGGGDWIKVLDHTPVGTSAVTFSTLGSYRHLRLMVSGAGDASATFVTINLTVNGDTGANYDWGFEGIASSTTANASATAADNQIAIGALAAGTAPTSTPGYAEYTFYHYRDTVLHKVVNCDSGVKTANNANNIFRRAGSGWWRNTAAITSITLTLSSGKFAAGSRISVYGGN